MKRLPTYARLTVLAALGSVFASQALAATSSGSCAQFFQPLPATIAGLSFAVAGGTTLSPTQLGWIEFAHNPITISFGPRDEALILTFIANVPSKNVTLTGVDSRGAQLFTATKSVPPGGAVITSDPARQLTISSDTDVWLSMVCFVR
jgi:hypothetical protein